MNSIKYILEKKGMQQKELVITATSKQSVSKWVNRLRKIAPEIRDAWEIILDVPSSYFIDEKGYCKDMDADEMLELEKYLDEKFYNGVRITNGKEEYNEYVQKMLIDYLGRESAVKRKAKRLKSLMYDTIFEIPDDLYAVEHIVAYYEQNLKFFERVIDIKRNFDIDDKLWDGIFKTIKCCGDLTLSKDWLKEDGFVCEFYELIEKWKIIWRKQEDEEQIRGHLREFFSEDEEQIREYLREFFSEDDEE